MKVAVTRGIASHPSAGRTHRYRALDTYRFLAASGVVFYHFENHFQPFLPTPTHVLERFQLFVDFFFVLSGFVIMHTYGRRITSVGDYRDFLRKRLARLYPLHLATIALFCALGALVVALHIGVRDRTFFDPSLIPANVLLIHAWGVTDHPGLNVPSWSISAEWFVYLLFPALVLVVRRGGAFLAFFLAIVLATGIETTRFSAGLGPGDVATYDFGNLRALPSFLAGMAVFTAIEGLPARRIPWFAVHGFGLVVVVSMLAGAPSWSIVLLFPPLVALVAIAERGGARTIFTSQAGVLLGSASFAIYMTHTVFQVAAVVLARNLGWVSVPQLIAIAFVMFAIIVIVGVASYRWFEDPLRRRLSYRREPGRLDTRPFEAR